MIQIKHYTNGVKIGRLTMFWRTHSLLVRWNRKQVAYMNYHTRYAWLRIGSFYATTEA
jgi:hypothetical protein